MSTVKQEVWEMLGKLPDTCTFEDVQYHLYILGKIRRGMDDVEAGRVLTQEQVEREISSLSFAPFAPLR